MGHHAFGCNFSRVPLTSTSVKIQSLTEHNHVQAQGTTVLHALADICANVTPAEKMAHQGLDMEHTPAQLKLLSNAQGPVSPALVQCFIYISCVRKWGEREGKHTITAVCQASFSFFSPDSKQ